MNWSVQMGKIVGRWKTRVVRNSSPRLLTSSNEPRQRQRCPKRPSNMIDHFKRTDCPSLRELEEDIGPYKKGTGSLTWPQEANGGLPTHYSLPRAPTESVWALRRYAELLVLSQIWEGSKSDLCLCGWSFNGKLEKSPPPRHSYLWGSKSGLLLCDRKLLQPVPLKLLSDQAIAQGKSVTNRWWLHRWPRYLCFAPAKLCHLWWLPLQGTKRTNLETDEGLLSELPLLIGSSRCLLLPVWSLKNWASKLSILQKKRMLLFWKANRFDGFHLW